MKKIEFADQLRGIAFISVLLVHWFGTFSLDRQLASTTINSDVASYGIEMFYQKIVPDFIPGFGFGPYGVGIFFVISGFVIPFSLLNKTKLQFIKSRMLRIMPTYVVCTLLSITLISLLGNSAERSYLSPKEIISNLTLFQTITLDRSVDMVNWTLAIEIKFYLICSLIKKQIERGSMTVLILVPLVSLFVNLFSIKLPGMLPTELIFISFMLSGVAINLLYRNMIKKEHFFLYVFYLMSVTTVSFYNSQIASQAFDESMSCTYALISFLMAYSFRSKIKPSKILRFISKISYPLYLIHVTFGFTALNILLDNGFSKVASYLMAIAIVTVCSYLIHITIEARTMSVSFRAKTERAA